MRFATDVVKDFGNLFTPEAFGEKHDSEVGFCSFFLFEMGWYQTTQLPSWELTYPHPRPGS